MNSRLKPTKRDFERMGFKYVGRSSLTGEHYNFYGSNRQEPQYLLNFNRKTGNTILTKCLDELTVDGLLSKIRLESKKTGIIDVIGRLVFVGVIGLSILAALKAFGINILG